MAETADFASVFQSFEVRSDATQVAPRIAALRERLIAHELSAFLVPRADAHRGESVPKSEARLAWLTGFSGSAGLAIVGRSAAGLYIDGRYTLQAPAETDTSVFEVRTAPPASLGAEIADFVPANGRIGYDPWLHTPAELRDLREKIGTKAVLVPGPNIVDEIWSDRPGPPDAPITLRSDNLAGRSAADKLADLRRTLGTDGADAVVLTLPESLCWLFNIRGSDVPNTPFVLGFSVIPAEGEPTIYVHESKLTDERLSALQPLVPFLRPVSEFEARLRALGGAQRRVIIDPASAPAAVEQILKESGASLIEKRDPVLLPKSKKNAAELSGMREAHRLDGTALARFLHWFDTEAPGGALDEISIVARLEAFRREEPTCLDASFDTISGAGPNGAIVHYRVNVNTNRRLDAGELMLVDSGAQYLSGTTDVTRTLSSGAPTDEQRDRFTRVLKGMIAISTARFPRGTSGAQIDVLARQFLWAEGLNYDHGTGHGVGAYLSVHEGPIGISSRYSTPLEPGMVISNEPGFYKAGEYGIRIENLIVVIESPVGGGKSLEFETLTLAPIDRRLIDLALLTEAERAWLDTYHARVLREIGPTVTGETKVWLEATTAKL